MKGNTTQDSNSRNKLLSITGTLLVVLASVTVLLSAGPGVALAANSPTTELADKTVSVNNDTQDVYLTVNNTSSQPVNYTVYGVDSDGLTTQVDSGQISASAGNETTKYFAANATAYTEYRFTVSEDGSDGDNETVQSVDVGKTVEQSAGGGGFFGGGGGLVNPLNIVIALLLAGVLYLLGVFDPVKRRIKAMQG